MTDPATPVRFTLALPTDDVRTLARNARPHWAARAGATTAVRHATMGAARGGGLAIRDHVRAMPKPLHVTVTARYPDSRPRDVDNVSGPAKSIIDGLGPPDKNGPGAGWLSDDDRTTIRWVTYGLELDDDDVRDGTVAFDVTLRPAVAS